VPTKFKPGHLFPTRNVGDLDETGLPETMMNEFRDAINEQKSGPRQRHQLFETGSQEVGWCFSQIGPVDERSKPSGNPPALGMGWDGHGGPLAKLGVADTSVAITDGANGWARPCQSQSGGIQARGLGPYAAYLHRHGAPRLQRRGHSRNQARRRRTQAEAARPQRAPVATRRISESQSVPSLASASAVRESQCEFVDPSCISADTASLPKLHAEPSGRRPRPKTAGAECKVSSCTGTSKLEACRYRPKSAPAIRAGPSEAAIGAQIQYQDEAIQQALERSRSFLNGHALSRHNSYYHPKSLSDASRYADTFALMFGKCLYHQ